MDNQTQKCPHCGASMKAWWHTLTPGLVNCLIKALKTVRVTNTNRFHLLQDLNLTKMEYNNFQKLRFHGLVAHADENKKSGYWLLTSRAGKFLHGEITIPKKVKTFRNRVIEHSEEVTGIADFRNQVEWFESEFNFDVIEN